METSPIRKGLLLCFIGPAGGGKTSHGDELLKNNVGTLAYSISATSRAPRAGEQDGVHYYFLTRKEFEEKIKLRHFFEHEEVHGNLYGTLRKTIDDAVRGGTDLLLDIDIKGALTFKKHFPQEAVLVFLVPPSAEILRKRILARGSVTEAELATRLETARKEYAILSQSLPSVDYFVVNDVREEAYRTLSSILEAERHRVARLNKDELARLCSVDH